MKCCGINVKWIENVVGKGYWFCSECRNEVIPSTPTNHKQYQATYEVDVSMYYPKSEEELQYLMSQNLTTNFSVGG